MTESTQTESMHQRLVQRFAADPIADQLGVRFGSATEDALVLELDITDAHVGDHGRCHGGVLFTFADIAMSYWGNRHQGQAYATTATIDYIAGVELGATVVATATEPSRRSKRATCDVALRVDDQVVALFRGTTLRVSET